MKRLAVCAFALGLLQCGGPDSFSLALLAPESFLGPTVLATDPAPGSAGIPVDYPLTVTFSAPLQRTTIFTGLTATAGDGTLPFTYATSADQKTITLWTDWPAGSLVHITAGANLKDLQGRGLRDQSSHDDEPDTPFSLAFTAGADRLADPPRVIAFDPPEGALGVPVAIQPGVTFSKRMHAVLPATTLLGPSGAVEHSTIWERDRTVLRVRPAAPLKNDTLYLLRIEYARDAWGRELAAPATARFAIRKGGGRVLINEVVSAPLQDWGETSPGDGFPFNQVPGSGSITASDEWIEIYNGADAAVDLTGWSLEMLDGSNQTHILGIPATGLELYAPATANLQHFEAGAFLVIGNPVGDNSDTVVVVLRDQYGLERDRVSLGNGAPNGGGDTLAAEAVARIPNGADTGDDSVDWRRAFATPGGSN